MIDDLIDTLIKEGGAVKPAPHPFKLSLQWIAGATLYLTISLLVFGVRPGLSAQFHRIGFDAEIAALITLIISTSLSAALLVFPDLHQIRRLAYTPLAAFALLIAALFVAWQQDNPPAPLPVHSFECTLGIALFSLLPAIWTFFVMKKYASTHYHLAGSVALLFAFSVGALWLRLHENTDSVAHVIEWHYLPMLGIGLLGLWLGQRLLRW